MNSDQCEHLQNTVMWKRFCTFVKIDPRNTTNEPYFTIPGIKHKALQYQVYAAFLLLFWASEGKNGGILADSMGLGKVRFF